MILKLTKLLQHWTYKLYELADDINAAAERREIKTVTLRVVPPPTEDVVAELDRQQSLLARLRGAGL